MTAITAAIPKNAPSVIPTIIGTFDFALIISVHTPFVFSRPAGHMSTQYKKVQFSGVITFVILDEYEHGTGLYSGHFVRHSFEFSKLTG